MRSILKIISLFFIIVLLASCAAKKERSIKVKDIHKGPLIKPSDVVVEGRKEMDRMIKAGPKPYEEIDEIREDKRKTITTESVRNYVTIPEDYSNLKQDITLNLNSVDFKFAMALMADIGDINILIGDEVSGTVTAKLKDVAWDVAFQTLLDMKSLGADVDVARGIIRIHTPEKLTTQETFKSSRAEVLKKKIQLEEEVEPILAEIFKLYYIAPEDAKKTLEDLFNITGSSGADTAAVNTMSNLKITVENTTRSIIVRGHQPDLDVIDSVIREIDVKTKQVLIEAFIVEATSDFAQELGSRVGAVTETNPGSDRSTTISGTVGGAATAGSDITLGAAAGSVVGNLVGANATSGIGILKQFSTGALKVELDALERLDFNRTLSAPSVFTLNNQTATITQGDQIPYQTTSDGTTTTEFKEAALKLEVTPAIIGDGNVLLDIKVNQDTQTPVGDEIGIKTNEIVTKLLISDGDIVVIGGIKKNEVKDNKSRTPGLSKAPVVGNLFKGRAQGDKLTELLIFISSRVIE